jgi:hypothetical protein
MIPLAVDPNVTILVDDKGKPLCSATNVAPDLKVTVTQDISKFEEEAKGKTFIKRNL